MPASNHRKLHNLRTAYHAAVASGLVDNLLEGDITFRQTGGVDSLLHADVVTCFGRNLTDAHLVNAQIGDALRHPNLCDCARSTSRLGDAGAALELISDLEQMLTGCADLLKWPGEHRWIRLARIHHHLERLSGNRHVSAANDEARSVEAAAQRYLALVERDVISRWKVDVTSDAALLPWLIATAYGGRISRRVADGDSLEGIIVAGGGDERDATTLATSAGAAVAAIRNRDRAPMLIIGGGSDIYLQARTLQWGLASAIVGHSRVTITTEPTELCSRRGFPTSSPALIVKNLPEGTDATSAKFLVESISAAGNFDNLDDLIAVTTAAVT